MPCAEVRRTCQFVMEHQTSVMIQKAKIEAFVQEMEAVVAADGAFVFDKWSSFHLSDVSKYSLEQLTAYVFVTDAMNFCFWPDNPAGEFEYENMTRNLEKIIDTDPEFFTAERLARVTEDEIRQNVFDGNQKFALVDERARLVRELGQRMLDI